MSGFGIKEIAIRYNAEGIPSPNRRRWTKATIHELLRNPAYVGDLVYGVTGTYHRQAKLSPVIVRRAMPAVIDRETFEAVRALLHSRAPAVVHPRRVPSQYLLSGLLRCGGCGGAMMGHDAKSGQYRYYVCGLPIAAGGMPAPPNLCPRSPSKTLSSTAFSTSC